MDIGGSLINAWAWFAIPVLGIFTLITIITKKPAFLIIAIFAAVVSAAIMFTPIGTWQGIGGALGQGIEDFMTFGG